MGTLHEDLCTFMMIYPSRTFFLKIMQFMKQHGNTW